MTLFAYLQTPAMEAIDKEDVLEAIIHFSSTISSISENTFCFIFRFSIIASIIKLLPFTSSNFLEKLILFIISSFSLEQILSF